MAERNETAAAVEASFRKGFLAGWVAALEAGWQLASEGADFDLIYETAGEFADDLLRAWARTNPTRRIPAPSLAGE